MFGSVTFRFFSSFFLPAQSKDPPSSVDDWELNDARKQKTHSIKTKAKRTWFEFLNKMETKNIIRKLHLLFITMGLLVMCTHFISPLGMNYFISFLSISCNSFKMYVTWPFGLVARTFDWNSGFYVCILVFGEGCLFVIHC